MPRSMVGRLAPKVHHAGATPAKEENILKTPFFPLLPAGLCITELSTSL